MYTGRQVGEAQRIAWRRRCAAAPLACMQRLAAPLPLPLYGAGTPTAFARAARICTIRMKPSGMLWPPFSHACRASSTAAMSCGGAEGRPGEWRRAVGSPGTEQQLRAPPALGCGTDEGARRPRLPSPALACPRLPPPRTASSLRPPAARLGREEHKLQLRVLARKGQQVLRRHAAVDGVQEHVVLVCGGRRGGGREAWGGLRHAGQCQTRNTPHSSAARDETSKQHGWARVLGRWGGAVWAADAMPAALF